MPIIATILVSPHPLQPGWWDGHHWSERQTARCSNDFLRGTDSGPPQPPGNADIIIWTIESSEASVISFNVSLDVPGPRGSRAVREPDDGKYDAVAPYMDRRRSH